MKIKHVIIDGSNIATEGRDAPSLAQLDEAVQAFIEEYSPDYVTVVVDATFPNRIDAKERKTYEDAVNANELVTPPAGAIGRGDAFVLQIAKRAGASILSNDSFQEFHGEYPWLFEKGRLIGGKPVPHVGWVFMERAPVRGPTSRRAVSEARKVAKAAERVAKTTTKAAATTEAVAARDGDGEDAGAKPARKRRSRAKAAEPVAATGGDQIAAEAALDAAAGDGAGEARGRGSRVPDPYNEALPFIDFVSRHPVGSEVDAEIERFSSHGAYVMVGEARAYVPLRHLADPAPRSAKEMLRVGETRRFVVVTIDPPRRGIDLAVPGVVEVPAAPPAADDRTEAVEIDDTVVAVPGDAAEPAPTRAEARRAAAAAARAARAAVEGAAEPAAKAPARKKAAARKAAAAEKAPAKRTRGRKAAAADAVQAGAEPEAAEPAPSRKRAARTTAAAAEAPAEAPAGAGGAPTATTSSTRKAAKKAAKAAKPAAAKATKATRSTATRAAKPTKAPTAAKATKATRSTTAGTATKAAKAAKAPRRPRAAPAGDDEPGSAGPEAEVVPLPANGAAASAAGA
jgi:hypothetical protein